MERNTHKESMPGKRGWRKRERKSERERERSEDESWSGS
jgi:hypothetical protein